MSEKNKVAGEGNVNNSRRDFVKKAAYVAPAILSLQAHSALASSGSVKTGPDSEVDAEEARLKKILCLLKNRVRARRGLPPTPC
jgi:hypothetical protein